MEMMSARARPFVVNTVTTLGAIFSTIGANVAVIPSRVGTGVSSCAAAANTPASRYKIVTTKDARPDNSLLHNPLVSKKNRMLDGRRPFFAYGD